MIICSKHEGNGTYREFVLDDRDMGDKVAVKTHVSRRGCDAVGDDEWREAGVITRSRDGLLATVFRPGARKSIIKLDKVFPNEIAALQAIAVSYDPMPAHAH